MNIGIIADIHGNAAALRAVLAELNKFSCEKIVALGDLAGYYCQINKAAELCIENKIVSIKGNHDHYLLSGTGCPRSKTANLCLEYQKKIMNDTVWKYLNSFGMVYNNDGFWAVHGGVRDFLDEYTAQFDFSRLPVDNCNIFCTAHSHKQVMEEKAGIVYFNPGSVGQPRDKDPRAAFAVICDGMVQLHRVEYDIDEVANDMRQAGFSARYYENLYSGEAIATFRPGIDQE